MNQKLLSFLTIFILIQIYAPAQNKRTYTTHYSHTGPKIDGHIDDSVWHLAAWQGGFMQTEPYDSVTPSQETAFKIIYTDNYIYFAAQSLDNNADKIYAPLANRDEEKGDVVSLRLDSYHDLRTAFVFTVSASGVKQDQKISNDWNWDVNWNAIWDAKTYRDSLGWYAEMEIPFTQLRFGNDSMQVWGLQVKRKIFRTGELTQWQYRSPRAPGHIYFFGELHGISNIKPKRQLTVSPYLVGAYEHYLPEADNVFTEKGHELWYKAGFDAKLGITNDFTLDLTVNPDFGQIEADPSEVNLTAFETFYAEKRPFFIEGKNLLEMKASPGEGGLSDDNLFYSRRLGRTPHYSPEDEEYQSFENPANTSIISAMKLTGKTQSGVSIGILESVTGNEYVSTSRNDTATKLLSEPLTNYLIVSATKDFNKGESILQGMLTASNRNINHEHLHFLPTAAYTGGVDYSKSFKGKKYYINTKFLMSHVRGDSTAMINLQSSSLRYFQRPDATHLTFDSTRTSLTGTAGSINFGKGGGGNTQYSVWLTWRSPSLELNDVGYQREADHIQQVLWYNIRKMEPWKFFRSMQLHINEWLGGDFSGSLNYFGVNIYTDLLFKNFWGIEFGSTVKPRGISNSNLRGGPGIKDQGAYELFFKIKSDQRKKLILQPEIFIAQGFSDFSNTANAKISIQYQASDKIQLELSPYYNYFNSYDSYIDTKIFNKTNSYILGSIVQRTIAAQLRVSINITPLISVQYYGQPFISSNNYSHIKKVNNPLANDIENRYTEFTDAQIRYDALSDEYYVDEDVDGTADYSFSNPDFSSIEFVSNLVFRYEFRPGSTFYFVWSQGRADYPETIVTSASKGFDNMFHIYPHDVFMIKFLYLIGR